MTDDVQPTYDAALAYPPPDPCAVDGVAPSYAEQLITIIRGFISMYSVLPAVDTELVLALYVIATHIGVAFDAFPYLAITSETKQSGKTRLMEVLSFLSHRPRIFTAMTDAVLFQLVRSGDLTLFIDEQEALGSGATSQRRAILNVGYRRGQTVPRAKAGATDGIVEWPVYCPKVFVLIGDMSETLRDRAITIRLSRATPSGQFSWNSAKMFGLEICTMIDALVGMMRDHILNTYHALPRMSWLPDRDEELWRPLFAVCAVLLPATYTGRLERIAADLSAMKTAPARRVVDLHGADDAATDTALAAQLLTDLLAVMIHEQITTADAIAALRALPRGPWRALRGTGLTARDMAHLLARFDGVKPRVLRLVSRARKTTKDTKRGYRRADVARAIARLNTTAPAGL
jgi:Protein of unknown function (DUF3631)